MTAIQEAIHSVTIFNICHDWYTVQCTVIQDMRLFRAFVIFQEILLFQFFTYIKPLTVEAFILIAMLEGFAPSCEADGYGFSQAFVFNVIIEIAILIPAFT